MKTLQIIISFLVAFTPLAGAAEKPNFVFILIDDMPWFGTPVRMDPDVPGSAMKFREMPNVETLAQQGMTFRNARAAAGMCGPSRCSIQTGMMTAHHLYSGNGGFGEKTDGNVTYVLNGKKAGLPFIEPEPQGNIRFPSIGDVLKPFGYATGHFGKWHLYGGGPNKHGYDESDGETDNGTFDPVDLKTGKKSDTSDDPKLMFSITKRSVDFMERQAKAHKPFYLQISHYATHALYQSRPATLAKYEKNPVFNTITNPRERRLAVVGAAMAEDLDVAIGMVLTKIKELGIADNTYVILTADNGYRSWNESYEVLRGGKWWLWDCGVRVPLIVRGPGIAAGARTAVNVVGYDFLPTIADLAGATSGLSKDVDGASFSALLLGKQVPDSYVNRPIFFHYPHYRVSPPSSAIVMGDQKLLHFYEWPDEEFRYDLKTDLGEKSNIATADPDKTAAMVKLMMDRIKAVGGYFPKPNPKADPKIKRYDPNDLKDQGEGDDPESGIGGKSGIDKKKK